MYFQVEIKKNKLLFFIVLSNVFMIIKLLVLVAVNLIILICGIVTLVL